MNNSFSIYLDFVRFFASALVLFYHAANIYNPHMLIASLGHDAVVVFFVLSGFVIAYVSDKKEKTIKQYALSRMARIYSVAIPAILLTILLDAIGFTINSLAYPEGKQAWDLPFIRVISSLIFTNELWTLSTQLFSNVPYWSLNYEVWYYVGFAFIVYIGGKKGWILFGLLAFFIGIKIVLLMPIWWMGVYAYRSHLVKNLSLLYSVILLVISIFGISIYLKFGWGYQSWNLLKNILGDDAHKELAFSRQFISDYYLGVMVGMHFVGVRSILSHYPNALESIAKPIRLIAGSTFTLYLIHQPLLLFFYAVFYTPEPTFELYSVIIALTLLFSFAIATQTEQKKHVWKSWITKLYNAIEGKMSKLFGTHRGFIRLVISTIKWKLGFYRKYEEIDYQKAKRLVFVCQGNICRSPFAHYMAEKHIDTVPVVSIGLATYTGSKAFPMAIDVSKNFSIDLSQHKATDVADFDIYDGDVFFVMEDRHIKQLEPHIQGKNVQVALLGLWCVPKFALLYDPYKLNSEYFFSCFERIRRSVICLSESLEVIKKND